MTTKHRRTYFTLPLDMPDLLTPQDLVAIFPGTTTKTWHQLRHKNAGPAATKVAGRLFYPRFAVEEWANDNMQRTP